MAKTTRVTTEQTESPDETRPTDAMKVQIAVTATKVTNIEEAIADLKRAQREGMEEIKKMLECNFVAVEAFKPVQAIAYGMVALITGGVVAGILALVLK